MFTLMEDPVLLPTSNISIDRSTIKSHLLSDATDPFNRMPLNIKDVIDSKSRLCFLLSTIGSGCLYIIPHTSRTLSPSFLDIELREQIQEWKLAQRNKHQRTSSTEHMDVDE